MTTTIYTTGAYYYAVEVGMPTDAIRMGEGSSADRAIASLAPTPMQSAGADTYERDMTVIRSFGDGVTDDIIDDLRVVDDDAAHAALDDSTQDTASTAIETAIAAFAGLAMTRSEVRALLRMAIDVSADLDEASGEE